MKFVFLGPPGAGKGTMASDAARDFRVPHISTGELFREAVKAGSPLGLSVKAILDSGSLVPDQLTVDLVKERLARLDAATGWILDGFPRTVAQAEALGTMNPPDLVVNFDVADEAVVSRLAGRRGCPSCGKIYHIKNVPPKKEGICDACGLALVQRPDDAEAAIRHRLSTYRAQTAPLIGFYDKLKLLLTIDATGMPALVYAGFKKAMESR
jgi:adenylate kinase